MTRNPGALRPLLHFSERIAETVLQTLYPNACILCGAPTADVPGSLLRLSPPLDAVFCEECQKELVAPAGTFCPRCGSPGICAPGCGSQLHFDVIAPLQYYRGLARAVVLKLKLERGGLLAKTVGQLCARAKAQELAAFAPDCVVGTPMHWRRRFARGGVCSPVRIARELARALGVAHLSKHVYRNRATPPQTSVNWDLRRDNVRGAFAVRGGSVFRGRRVVLVDDACTSGATVSEIADVLKSAGASAVFVIALTKGGIGKHARSR